MKSILKVTALITSFAAFGLIAGCGDDTVTPTGKVVKGPVKNEKVMFGTITAGVFSQYSAGKGTAANFVATTNSNGTYVVLIPGKAIATKGVGSYVDPVTKATVTAPVLKAPAGSANISTLTTLVALDATGAVKAKIEALGIKYDADLSGTVTAANQAAVALNESIGTILQTAGAANVDAIATNFVAVLNGLSAASLTAVAAAPATLTAQVLTPALTAAQTAGTITAGQLATISTNVANVVTFVKPGVVISGATGGSSTGTGAGQ